MLLKSCSRCRRLIEYPNTYCERCRPIAEEERRQDLEKKRRRWNARYNKSRDPRYARFYSSVEWRRLRKAKMQDAGYRCEDCGALAVEVHHVEAIQTDAGWERRLDWTNLKALCLDCHNRAHGRFQSRKRRMGGHRRPTINH